MDSAFRCCEGLTEGVDGLFCRCYGFFIFYDGVGFYRMAVFEKWLRNSQIGAQCEAMRKVEKSHQT